MLSSFPSIKQLTLCSGKFFQSVLDYCLSSLVILFKMGCTSLSCALLFSLLLFFILHLAIKFLLLFLLNKILS